VACTAWGVSVVNALSESLKVWIKRDGKEHYMDFVRGDTTTQLTMLGKVKEKDTGTKVWFKPDHEIFTELHYDYSILQSRLRELSFLNKGVQISLKDEREARRRRRRSTPRAACASSCSSSTPAARCCTARSSTPTRARWHRHRDRAAVQRRLQRDDVLVREQHQHARGRHAPHGFKSALTSVINKHLDRSSAAKKDKDLRLSGDDVREGMTAVLSIKVKEPQFEGQTKTKLGNSESSRRSRPT